MPNPFSYSTQFPKDFQIADPMGMLMPAWHYFLQGLWMKCGSDTSVNDSYYIASDPTTDEAAIYNSIDRTPASGGGLTIAPKQAPATQTLTASPWTFQAPASGFLTLSGGQVEYSRNGTSYFPVSMTGGQVMVLTGDWVRVVWYGGPPTIVWWQGGVAG